MGCSAAALTGCSSSVVALIGEVRKRRSAEGINAYSNASTANPNVGHLLRQLAPQVLGAIAHYRAAAERTTNIPERSYLTTKAARLAAQRKRVDIIADSFNSLEEINPASRR